MQADEAIQIQALDGISCKFGEKQKQHLDDVMFTHKDVGRFDVSVDYIVLMEMLQPFAHLDEVFPNHLLMDAKQSMQSPFSTENRSVVCMGMQSENVVST